MPRTGAEHFAFLVFGAALDRALFETKAPTAEHIQTHVHAGVDTFLRAYR
ncbi:TetR/AcrR family transcriptional regulator C-terminal domain-containing protein [Amycolatopsis jiangsuensis]